MGRKVEERRDLELIVIAKLLEINNASIVSSQHYGLVMKYQFITLLEQRGGTKEEFKVEEGEVILIVHGAPDLPRSSYHKVCFLFTLLLILLIVKIFIYFCVYFLIFLFCLVVFYVIFC